MAWTKGQQDAIDSRGESLLISAAAGSGKTAVLVERITGLIKEGSDLSRMLIVTFTEAAAAEMRERISNAVGAAAVRHSHISTFHAFAISVIKKYYHVTGINPHLAICDEYKKKIFKDEALDEMFEALFEAQDAELLDFLNCYCSFKDNNAAREMILQLYDFLQSLPEPEAFADAIESGAAFNERVYLDYAAYYARNTILMAGELLFNAKVLLEHPPEGSPMPKLAEKLAIDISNVDSILASLEAGRAEEAFRAADAMPFQRMATTKAEKESWELTKERITALRDAAKKEFKKLGAFCSGLTIEKLQQEKELTKKPLSELIHLEKNFAERFALKKKKAGMMDFSDIEHFALDILKNEDVCAELREKFDHIFVDEYQDSNAVQDKLISCLARDDNQFFVGDVKQSIYKFRLAEPELFMERYMAYKNGRVSHARAIDLNSNFRSKSSVIKAVNRVFEGLMTKDSSGIEYDADAALVEGNPYTGDINYEPKLYLVATKSLDDEIVDEAIKELKGAELEALQAARLIKEYYGKTIYDSKKGLERPLEYRDMVILLPAVKTHGELYYNALEAADIPVFLERGQGYFDTPEIQVFLNLLRIIDNFKQDIPLISVLHFPSFGFCADELADIRIFANANGLDRHAPFSEAFRFYANKGSDEALKEKAQRFLMQIEGYKTKASCEALADFCWELLSDSGVAQFAQALPAGIQRYANLRALVDKAQSYEQQSAGGLFGFISYMEIISNNKNGVPTGQISILGEGTDAVRIMTIHKSKGLEFPFVLIAGLGSAGRKIGGNTLDMHKDFGASIRIANPKKNVYYVPRSMRIIAAKKEKDEYAERIRVLYVAMTRAKDILLMTAAAKDPEKLLCTDSSILSSASMRDYGYVGKLLPYMPRTSVEIVYKSQLVAAEQGSPASDVLSCLDSGFEIDSGELPISAEELKARLLYDYSPSPDSQKKRKYSVSMLASAAQSEKTAYERDSGRRIPLFAGGCAVLDGASKGNAYHKVMEKLPFTREGKSIEEIKVFIEGLKERNLLSAEEAAAVDPKRVAVFFSSELGQRAIASKELHKEASFVLKTEYEGSEVYVQGTIDCYFKEGDSYVLIDYKSNYVDFKNMGAEKARLKELYLPQLKLYREALEKITKKRVSEAALYLFGINDYIKLC